MKYDFTSMMERKGLDAMAVDAPGKVDESIAPLAPKEGFDLIPMWVADMNFPTCPAVTEAIIGRAKHPAFGYFVPRDEYYREIIEWHKKRHGAKGLTAKCIHYENGVLGGLLTALSVFCPQGGNVLVHSPTYIGFTHSMEPNGYHMVLSPLVRDEEGVWRMDFEDMEKKIVDHDIHAAVFCSPHNPCGRVWTGEEISRFMALCEKHDVYVISDEIWSDLVLAGHTHIPTQSVSEDARMRTVALYAPSKTFNLAGLVGAYHIIYNREIREKVRKAGSRTHYNQMNVLSMYALIGAYSPEGYVWTDELCDVLTGNVQYACWYIRENLPGLSVFQPEGTYMLFVDCSEYCASHERTLDDILHAAWDVGVAVQDGRPFHGPCHFRMNLALPLERVQEAFYRLSHYVFAEEEEWP